MMDIVWAEDSGADQFLIQSVLDERAPPLRVAFASDGEEALRLVSKHRPAVVVLDVRMPGLGGIAALRRLRADARSAAAKVIMFSSTAEAKELEEARALGAIAAVQKPMDFDEFKAAVRAIAKQAVEIRLGDARAAMSPASAGKHHVLFWDSEWSLMESVKQFLQAGLRRGDGTIALATPAHLARLQRDFAGSDTVWLSTDDVCKAIRVAGRYDLKRFGDLFERAVATASKGGKRSVSCFGELVAVLQEGGDGAAAAELETIGQAAAAANPDTLSILCSYPVTSFTSTEAMERACRLHASHELSGRAPLGRRPLPPTAVPVQ